ncbi:MAG TPA: M13 family metallopeptidase [Terriglobales bacterium]|jgi:predicted metalloendopeptidase
MANFRTAALATLFACAFALTSFAADPNSTTHDSSQDIDRSIKPGDDFYRYANGNWLKSATIPEGQPSYDTRTIITARTSQRVRDLIQQAASTQSAKDGVTQKVGDYYASFMDESSIETKGMAPLVDEMSAISEIKNKTSLSAYLGATLNTEVDGLTSNADHVFGAWVNQSFTDSEHYVFHLWQGGLGMPDRDAYLDPNSSALRIQYQSHIASMLRLAGVADTETKAARILNLEIQIAKTHAPDSDAADVFKQNNPWKRTDFALKAPGMDWDAYFKAAGVAEQSEFVVWQPSAVTGTAALVDSESVDVWKDYLKFHLIEHYSNVLPKAVVSEHFAFYGAILSSQQQAPERSLDAITATNAALGQAVGQLYTARYFPPEAKAKAQAMVNDLIAAYRARIPNLTWMSAQTKEKALAKLATLRVGVGYPDTWIDYSSLEIIRGDAFGNMRRAESFNRSYNLAKLRRPADVDEWRIDPQIVGAIILFSPNTETFSAGILQPPYFDFQGDTASNYGSAGAGMAHEISHSFDELGNIYDAQGRLEKWWTAEDEAKYHATAAKLVTQFSAYCPVSDACVNGEQVLTENIADLTGLLIAHDAYVLSLKGKEDAVINGLTGEQRFFLAFAQRWRKAQTEAALRKQVKSDTHSPGQYRSDTVRNVDAWYRAYDVMPDNKLYVKPEDRVGIW